MSRIRTLCLLGVVLGTAGCIIDGDDDGAFIADWQVLFLGNELTTCKAAGTPTVTMEVARRGGERFTESFDCALERGRSRVVPPGTYDVTMTLENSLGEAVSGISGTFDVTHRGLVDLEIIRFQVQSFVLTWSINKAGFPVKCADVGATTVHLVTQRGQDGPITYPFPCSANRGVTQAIPLDTYSVYPQLLDANGRVLDSKRAMTVDAGETERDANNQLVVKRAVLKPPVTFELP